MKRLLLAAALIASCFVVPGAVCAQGAPQKALTLDVWPGKAPGDTGEIAPEKELESKPGKPSVKRITNVSRPTLTVFRPAKDKDTGAAVVIAPGGGYNILAWDLEGEEVAAWLNSVGVTGIVLKYRVPRRPDQPKDKPPIGPLQDAQRALSLVRSKAPEWGIDPKRIGILGFSAGGHLTAAAATNFDKRAYESIDTVDKVSCRPDFAVLVYPAYLIAKGHRIVARRWRSPVGEVDIVARRRNTLIFVEVKARESLDEAAEAILPRQQRRIIAAAGAWLARHPDDVNSNIRFDVVLVAPKSLPRHIEAAFDASN